MPRVRVAALMLMDEKVVVVRHRFGQNIYYLLPGGGVDFGETLATALQREVLEETGFVCEVGRPLILNDTIAPSGDRHIVNITFEAHIVGGTVTDHPQDERVEHVDLVTPTQLGELDFRPPIADQIVQALKAGAGWECMYAGSVYTAS
ncbi:MAG: NUDIX hydrolase [Coriobacteriia bacterium]|nr:NUDIX hydrolase [Coriobacteriia bacterium]